MSASQRRTVLSHELEMIWWGVGHSNAEMHCECPVKVQRTSYENDVR